MNEKLKNIILEEKKIIKEMSSLFVVLERTKDREEKKMISSHINLLESALKKRNDNVPEALKRISLVKSLDPKIETKIEPELIKQSKLKTPIIKEKIKPLTNLLELEKETLKRIGKKDEKIIKKKVKKPSNYVKTANKVFVNLSKPLSKNKIFSILKTSLIKANMHVVPSSYISIILFTIGLSIIVSIFVFLFFLFFNFGPELPIITKVTENFGTRFLKIFWILFVIPLGTTIFMYFYPSIEKKSIENKINRELPFATIHMSAISGSMIEPSKIFNIINSTGEYPNISKEFTKLINEINVYGYNLVGALRNLAFNCPSAKLSELFNGLASTINSGGDLQDFFEKRSQSLLFEYKIENEKRTKTAETFMDIYISIVIAAPMIFMLVLMMMKISGLGISLSTSMISLIMVSGVAVINVVFLTFLHLKQPGD